MKDRKRRILVISIIVLIVFGTLLGLYIADFRARRSATMRAETVLVDSANEQAATLAAIISGRIQVLTNVAVDLATHDLTDPAAIEAYLNDIAADSHLSFAAIALIDTSGIRITADAEMPSNVSDRRYFIEAISGKPAVENVIGRKTGKSCVALAVPYYKDGVICGVLRGLYYEENLRQLLLSQSYGGAGFSLVVNSKGDVIVNAENPAFILKESNLFDFLSRATFLSGNSLSALKASLAAGETVTTHYSQAGETRIAALVPLGSRILPENDWFLLNVVHGDELTSEIGITRRDAIDSMSVFAAFSILALALFLLLERDYQRRRAKDDEALRQREEQFRIMAEQSGHSVFRYDVRAQRSERSSATPDNFGGTDVCENVVETCIQTGVVAEESADDYRAFFQRIANGESPLVAEFLMRQADGAYRWYRHISTTIFDKKGKPQTAVVSYYDCTEQREREIVYARWQQDLSGASYENAALFEWNLTRDVYEGARGAFAASLSDFTTDSFDSWAEAFVRARVFDEDRMAALTFISREHLIGMYYDNILDGGFDYRFLTDDGSVRWHSAAVQMVPYPDTQDIKLYITDKDIDTKKREELMLIARSEQDSLTGTLNRDTFITRVDELILRSPASSHALLMLDVDGFKHVNDMMGHNAGDAVLVDFVDHIHSVLRANDLVGRLGGDEFMVCLPDMPFDAAIEKKAQQLCAALRKRLSDQLSISVSIGIAVYPRDGLLFSDLYRAADAALYHAKAHGKDSFAFYRPELAGNVVLSPNETAVSERMRRTVLLISDARETSDQINEILSDSYDILRASNITDLTSLLDVGSVIYAVILDADSAFGRNALHSVGAKLRAYGMGLFALSGDSSSAMLKNLIDGDITTVIPKPIDRELLLLCLERLRQFRDMEQTKLQSEYHRLQTAEDVRYHEVLGATGTVVFIYDIATGTYQADLLSDRFTAGSFDGRPLSRILLEDGVAEKRDVDALVSLLDQVSAGELPRCSFRARLQTRTGERRWFEIQLQRMDNADTRTQKVLIIANDVNESVAAAEALRSRAERDALTGLYNRETFIEKAAEMIAEHAPGHYVMACFDIDNFKVINDQYGTETGDQVLKQIADLFSAGFGRVGGICCRVMADHFAVLYPASFMQDDALRMLREKARILDGTMPPITFSIGRYIVNDLRLSVSAMFDRAALAEATVKGRYDTQIALYDESMREHILKEQEISSEMNTALQSGQFELWIQPQFNHSSGALIGGEALVRWRRPKRNAMLSPNEFIPVFERNGFIYELDKYVWEQACILLRGWLDADKSPLPLSVNVSRYDIFRKDFYSVLTGLVEAYRLPVELLRLEITESAFTTSAEQIIGEVKRLREYGFIIEIDDFGSGYSSLNTLKDVPANVLKLDMRFLESNENSQRGGNILESIVRMAKWLNMPVIAEGVETVEQADYLRSIGCSYMQGFLYGKPMPVAEYEKLSEGRAKEDRMITLETVAALDNNAFWDPASMETLVFNNYVGGACIFEYHDGETELLRVNEKYAQEIGGSGTTMEEALSLRLNDHMDAQNLSILDENLRRAIASKSESTCELQLTGMPDGAPYTYLRSTARVIARSDDRLLFYCSVSNITAQRDAELKLKAASERLQTIMDNVNGGVTAVYLIDGVPQFVFANDQYFAQLGYTREQYHNEVQNAFDLVYATDREAVSELTRQASLTQEPVTCTYRAVKRSSEIIWLQSNISITSLPGVSEPVQLSVANDITAMRKAEQAALESSAHLAAIMQNVSGGVSAATLTNGEIGYLFVNDNYYSMFGYTKEQFESELPRGLVDLIEPADLPAVYAAAEQNRTTGKATVIEYRVRKRDGTQMWVRSNSSICHISGIDRPVYIAVTNDITNQKESERAILDAAVQLRFLNDVSHDLLTELDPDEAIESLLHKILGYFDGTRAYVFELDWENRVANNTYEVCAANVSHEMEMLQEVPFVTVEHWLDAFERSNHVYIRSVGLLDDSRSAERAILEAQNVASVVAVPLRRDGRLIGFMGVDDPSQKQSHVDRLEALGDYMAVILTRRDLIEKIKDDSNTLINIMNDTPGGFSRMRVFPDRTIQMVYCNEGFCKLIGMQHDEVMGRYGIDAMWGVHPDDVPVLMDLFDQMLASGESCNTQYRLFHASGNYCWALVNISVTKNESGEVFLNAHYTDLSEQNRMEQQRQETLDDLPCGAGVFEVVGNYVSTVYLNHRYAELVGRYVRNSGNTPALDAVFPEDRDLLLEALHQALTTENNISCTLRILHGDGGYRPFRIDGKLARQRNDSLLIYAAFFPIAEENPKQP